MIVRAQGHEAWLIANSDLRQELGCVYAFRVTYLNDGEAMPLPVDGNDSLVVRREGDGGRAARRRQPPLHGKNHDGHRTSVHTISPVADSVSEGIGTAEASLWGVGDRVIGINAHGAMARLHDRHDAEQVPIGVTIIGQYFDNNRRILIRGNREIASNRFTPLHRCGPPSSGTLLPPPSPPHPAKASRKPLAAMTPTTAPARCCTTLRSSRLWRSTKRNSD